MSGSTHRLSPRQGLPGGNERDIGCFSGDLKGRVEHASGISRFPTSLARAAHAKKNGLQSRDCNPLSILAEWTGLEPATPGVTGRYSNQLNYHSTWRTTRATPLEALRAVRLAV
jgi:hypothetical protein